MTTQPNITGVTPYVNLRDARAAIELYRRAFGAEVLHEVPAQDGKRLMHCCVRLNGGHVFMSDPFPEHGCPAVEPQGFTLHLQVADADAAWKRAVDAGLEISMPLGVQFWGDKYGQLRDAFGVTWSIGGPNR